MRKIIALLAIACTVGMTSCKKEFQRYEGPTQIAFDPGFTLNITPEIKSVTLPALQLISTGEQPEIVADIAVNAKSTGVAAVTVPKTGKIDAGRFIGDVVIPVNYSALTTDTWEANDDGTFSQKSNKNVLLLDLSSTSVHVAPNLKQSKVTLVQVQVAIKSKMTVNADPDAKVQSVTLSSALNLIPAASNTAPVTATLAVDAAKSNCLAALTVPATSLIAAKSTSGNIVIPFDYALLNDETWTADKDGKLTVLKGNANVLVLNLVSTTNVKMSTLTQIEVKIVKKKPAEKK